MLFQGGLKSVLKVLLETFKVLLRECRGIFKKVLKVILLCFREGSMVFQENFKEILFCNSLLNDLACCTQKFYWRSAFYGLMLEDLETPPPYVCLLHLS